MQKYLSSTEFIDYDNDSVKEFAEKHSDSSQSDTEKAIALYYAVRDGFFYNPYQLNLTKEGLKASNLLTRNHGYCIEKAILYAAVLRYVNIPSRLFFGNVRNHIATERLEAILETNILVFHGGTEVFLNEKWVKATPAFNLSLCKKLNVEPLEFDGTENSLFQQYDKNGNLFMEYLHEYGSFDDLPFDLYLSELRKHYSHLLGKTERIEGFELKM